MSLLTFSFYMLSEHPDIEKRLRQEIYEKVGRTGRPSYDQMREMKYMRAFLNGMYSQFCIHQVIDNRYFRGAKIVSPGVSFSLSRKVVLTLMSVLQSSRYQVYAVRSFSPFSLVL